MVYYWIVKHDSSELKDIISYREELNALRPHHIVVESLNPSLSAASFALGHQIKTETTWRDLNDTLVTYLQSQRVQDDKERSILGVNIGTIVIFKNPVAQNMKASFSKTRGGIF